MNALLDVRAAEDLLGITQIVGTATHREAVGRIGTAERLRDEVMELERAALGATSSFRIDIGVHCAPSRSNT